MILYDKLHRPLKTIRISITNLCNFYCPHCRPKNYSKSQSFDITEMLDDKEITRIVKIFFTLGIQKVRITGGEPLLRQSLPQLITKLRKISDKIDIALTTNGSLLKNMAQKLIVSGLNRLTISINSLDPSVFQQTTNSDTNIYEILAALAVSKENGFHNIKLNCVLQKNTNESDILSLAQFARINNYMIRFIEFMDVGTKNQWSYDNVISSNNIVNIISREWPMKPTYNNNSNSYLVAQKWSYIDGKGEVGFISSITKPFCSSCDRIRLSSNGLIYNCLFAKNGFDIKYYIRNTTSDEAIIDVIKDIWSHRNDEYSELRHQNKHMIQKSEMFFLGG